MKAGDESAAHASVIAREAEVRGGELLKGMNLKATTQAKPGSKVGKKDPTLPRSPLKSLGLTPSESKRMQAAAAVPEKVRREVSACVYTRRKSFHSRALRAGLRNRP